MKLIVDGMDLAEAVSTVSRTANAKTVNPVLEGIKLVASGDRLTLSATDLEIYVQKTIRADVKTEGTVVVPGRLFSEYVKKLGDSKIDITGEGESILIRHGDNVCNFQCLLLVEYPDIINLSAKPHFSIKSEYFRDFISKTVISASNDDSRPILKGVLCEVSDNQLIGVALDGFRLSKVTKKIENHKLDIKIVIPARSLEEIKKLLSDDSGTINVLIENKFFQVNTNSTTFATRLIDGDFINYKQIIPASFESSVVVEKSEFERAVERAGLLVRNDKINLVTLKVADKTIGITSNNEIGKIAEKIKASLSGKDMSISFNAKFLHDALRNTQNDYIKLNFNTDVSPCVLTATKEKESDFLFLILPVRMN